MARRRPISAGELRLFNKLQRLSPKAQKVVDAFIDCVLRDEVLHHPRPRPKPLKVKSLVIRSIGSDRLHLR